MNKKHLRKIFIGLSICVLAWVIVTSPPISFPKNTILQIEKGDSVKAVAGQLKQNRLIQFELLFINLVILFNLENKIVAGDYIFKEKEGVFEIIRRISTGDYGIDVKRVTIVEGSTVKDMAKVFSELFYNIEEEDFINQALVHEGYLFPETYFFPESVLVEDIIQKMRMTFDQKIAQSGILNSERNLKDIVIMASIIEKEASATSMQEVSDILWHRLDIDMPLQVDAGFVYERNQSTFDLSLEDLRTDSPYNTYTRRGLTPTPISNPGLQALLAAAFPQETEYLYFLTGFDGEMYYAKTLREHDENKAKYLRE